jgi:hypothetical protein
VQVAILLGKHTLKGLSNQTTFSTIESVAVLLNQNVSDKKILFQDHGWHSIFSTIALKDVGKLLAETRCHAGKKTTRTGAGYSLVST